jgi:hypothetical protein
VILGWDTVPPVPAMRLHLLLSPLLSLGSLLLWIGHKHILWYPFFLFWFPLFLSLTPSPTEVLFLFTAKHTWHNKRSPVKKTIQSVDFHNFKYNIPTISAQKALNTKILVKKCV